MCSVDFERKVLKIVVKINLLILIKLKNIITSYGLEFDLVVLKIEHCLYLVSFSKDRPLIWSHINTSCYLVNLETLKFKF